MAPPPPIGPPPPLVPYARASPNIAANAAVDPLTMPLDALDLKIADINRQLLIETKIRIGAENMLLVAQSGSLKGSTVPRNDVMAQLARANIKIGELSRLLEQLTISRARRGGLDEPQVRMRSGSTPSGADMHDPLLHAVRRTPSADKVMGGGSRRKSAPLSIDHLRRNVEQMHALKTQTLAGVLDALHAKPPLEEIQLETLDQFVRLVRQESSGHGAAAGAVHEARIHAVIPYLSAHGDLVRAAAYRCLRALSTSPFRILRMVVHRVDVFVIRTLTREAKRPVEKEQALKLIRQWLDVAITHDENPEPGLAPLIDALGPTHSTLVTTSLVRLLVAISEHPDDKMRLMAIETLCEMAMHPPLLPAMAQAGGVRAVCAGLLDCPREVTEFVALSVLVLVDAPESRAYFRRGIDVEVVAAAFSDAYGTRGSATDERLAAAARAILALLRHWTGIVYLVQNGRLVIRAIVDSLRIPFDEIRLAVLNLLSSIFRLEDNPPPSTTISERLDLHGHTMAALLLVFVKSGLFEALIDLIGSSAPPVVARATGLIGALIELCNRLLPEKLAVEVQSLPGLFQLASVFRGRESVRHRAISALAHIDVSAGVVPAAMDAGAPGATLAAAAAAAAGTGKAFGAGPASELSVNNCRPGFPQSRLSPSPSTVNTSGLAGARQRTDQVKVQMGFAMDDNAFRAMLNDSGVLAGKSREYTRWDWGVIGELLQGPLLNPRRVDEVLRSSKFFKRLASFFRPSKRLFCDLPSNRNNVRYIKIGDSLVTCLLASSDGQIFLRENRLLHDVAAALAGFDPSREGSSSHLMLAVSRLEKTLTMGYFTIVGSMARFEAGIAILSHFRFFTLFYHLSEITSRPDIMRVLIVSLDYSREGHCRILLSKFLTCTLADVRHFATAHLGTLLSAPGTAPADVLEWITPLLVTQLYDSFPRIQRLAVGILDTACAMMPQIKSALVQQSPTLDHLGDLGNPLFLRLLSTSDGFQYLWSTGYVCREYERWGASGYLDYVDQLELNLHQSIAKTLCSTLPFERGKYEELLFAGDSSNTGCTLPHFFGELAKTVEGVSHLKQRGHFRNLCHQLRATWTELATTDPRALKAILWAVGHVGSTKGGILFLEEEQAAEGEIFSVVCDVAALCGVLSVRGTAFHALGLLSKTPRGRDMLRELGWVCDNEHGFCVPADLDDLLEIPKWEYKGSHPASNSNDLPSTVLKGVANVASLDPVAREILETIASLNNQFLNRSSLRTLMRLRVQHPRYFQSTTMYLHVIQLFDQLHFRFAARKFIEDRFDALVLKGVLPIPAPPPPPLPPPTALGANTEPMKSARNGNYKIRIPSDEDSYAVIRDYCEEAARLAQEDPVSEPEAEQDVEAAFDALLAAPVAAPAPAPPAASAPRPAGHLLAPLAAPAPQVREEVNRPRPQSPSLVGRADVESCRCLRQWVPLRMEERDHRRRGRDYSPAPSQRGYSPQQGGHTDAQCSPGSRCNADPLQYGFADKLQQWGVCFSFDSFGLVFVQEFGRLTSLLNEPCPDGTPVIFEWTASGLRRGKLVQLPRFVQKHRPPVELAVVKLYRRRPDLPRFLRFPRIELALEMVGLVRVDSVGLTF
ncbi:Rapamycin-insensitive companion of mTOR, middle domain-containing protein [Blastocladiella britannica]|nr:Rapamycin-insensitive companion of mTOR, middle domain-containing protein [Blastocladiella britannica]